MSLELGADLARVTVQVGGVERLGGNWSLAQRRTWHCREKTQLGTPMEASMVTKLAARLTILTSRLAKLTNRLAKLATRLAKLAKRVTSSQLAVLGQVGHRLGAGTVAGGDGERGVAVLHASYPKNAATLAPIETVVVVVASRALVAGALATPTTMATLNHRLWGAEGMGIRRAPSGQGQATGLSLLALLGQLVLCKAWGGRRWGCLPCAARSEAEPHYYHNEESQKQGNADGNDDWHGNI